MPLSTESVGSRISARSPLWRPTTSSARLSSDPASEVLEHPGRNVARESITSRLEGRIQRLLHIGSLLDAETFRPPSCNHTNRLASCRHGPQAVIPSRLPGPAPTAVPQRRRAASDSPSAAQPAIDRHAQSLQDQFRSQVSGHTKPPPRSGDSRRPAPWPGSGIRLLLLGYGSSSVTSVKGVHRIGGTSANPSWPGRYTPPAYRSARVQRCTSSRDALAAARNRSVKPPDAT
jgi:hypothetical protein